LALTYKNNWLVNLEFWPKKMNVRSPVIVSEPDLAAHSLKASPLSLTPAVWSNQSESFPSQLLANFAGLRFLFSEWL
jgi:hypothetical protein